MKKTVYFVAVMAFALFAGLTSCDKKESMKELTVEASVLGDSIAQFKCTFSPTVSNGYFAFYTGDRISTEDWDAVFESHYGMYETFNESKTLYSYWLTAGHTYYFYAMTYTEKNGKATLRDVVEVKFCTPPSNGKVQALDVEWDKDNQIFSVAAPTAYDSTYVARWNSGEFSIKGNKSCTIYVQLKNPQLFYSQLDGTILVDDNNRFKIQLKLPDATTDYRYTASIPMDLGGYDVFELEVFVNVSFVVDFNGTILFESPFSPKVPGGGPIAS